MTWIVVKAPLNPTNPYETDDGRRQRKHFVKQAQLRSCSLEAVAMRGRSRNNVTRANGRYKVPVPTADVDVQDLSCAVPCRDVPGRVPSPTDTRPLSGRTPADIYACALHVHFTTDIRYIRRQWPSLTGRAAVNRVFCKSNSLLDNLIQVRPSWGTVRTDVYPHMPTYGHKPLLGKQSSPKWEIPCPGRPWTTVQNLTPLALSSPEKSVTVQNYKENKRYIHTLPIDMRGW